MKSKEEIFKKVIHEDGYSQQGYVQHFQYGKHTSFKAMSEYAEQNAIGFAEWIHENSWVKFNKGWLCPETNGSNIFYTTQELYIIYKEGKNG